MLLLPGTRLGSYEIVGSLGAGGMGEVYRARDTRLGREVAIKILPPRLAIDPVAVGRFEQEGRAVAALSHPNILALYDVGRGRVGHDEVVFAVMELLDGRTLREALSAPGGRLPLRKAVDYALQIAQGLAAAHAKGITHRDLKPENIFLTNDGQLKILDFGLAKVDDSGVGRDSDDKTATAVFKTDAGTVLGTTGYLSPEQAQGRPVDARSDIFSFGAVVYEMATGARAFKADSTIDTLHRIVHDQPTPVDTSCPEAPSELKWLLAKCLAKDPDERYQSTRDLVVDLRSLARVLESSPSLPKLPAGALTPAGRRSKWFVPAMVAAVAVLAIGAWLWARASRSPTLAPSSTKVSIERITSLGNVIDAVVSPDGKYVAYILAENARQGLWLRQLATASTLELVPPSAVGFWGANFSGDGSSIYYVIYTADEPTRALYRLPALGGTPRKVLTGLDTFPTFSPDGQQMAFLRVGPEAGTSSLIVADTDGSHLKVLATRRAPEFLVPLFFTAPAWSPDGTTIVCPLERREGSTVGTLVAYRATDGADVPLPHYEWAGIGQATWTPDGHGLVVVGGDRQTPEDTPSALTAGRRPNQLWWVSASESTRRPITSDLLDYRTTSITADGSALVTVASEATASLWSVPIDGSGEPRRLTTGRYDGLSGLVTAPGDRVLYRSLESGQPSLWMIDERTGPRVQVTTDGVASWPAALPDGRSMVYVNGQDSTLWEIGLDGQNRRPLPSSPPALYPTITPDGRTVIYVSNATGSDQVWKMPLAGGTPSRLLDGTATKPAISPDGTQLAVYYQERPDSPYVLAVFPIGGGRPTATFRVFPSVAFATVRWTADGKALLHNSQSNDRANVWRQPLSGGPAQQLTHFVDQTVQGFDLSTDGKRLVISRGLLNRDAVLIRNFLPSRP